MSEKNVVAITAITGIGAVLAVVLVLAGAPDYAIAVVVLFVGAAIGAYAYRVMKRRDAGGGASTVGLDTNERQSDRLSVRARVFLIAFILVAAFIGLLFGYVLPASTAEYGVWILLFMTLASGGFGVWAAIRGR
jgi:hypothetical protein